MHTAGAEEEYSDKAETLHHEYSSSIQALRLPQRSLQFGCRACQSLRVPGSLVEPVLLRASFLNMLAPAIELFRTISCRTIYGLYHGYVSAGLRACQKADCCSVHMCERTVENHVKPRV